MYYSTAIALVVLTTRLGAQSVGDWTDAGQLVSERSGHTVTALPYGRLLIVGGEVPEGLAAQAEDL